MERILLHHCRALLMDEAATVLDDAFVVVEGETIASVTPHPAGGGVHPGDRLRGATS